MNRERKIETEQVDAVTPPPRARVIPPRDGEGDHPEDGGGGPETAHTMLERKRDYLAGFLAGDKDDEPKGGAGSDLQAAVVEVMKSIYDPEIPVDIYELGLIYDIEIADDKSVTIRMTLTAPGCPVAGSLPGDVERRVEAIPEVKSATVELVWEPTWSRDMMSETALLSLGML